MSENKKVLFIVNKYSGTGYQDAIEGRIIDTCSRLQYECSIEFTKDRGHATELAQEAISKGFDLCFAVGGDGTVNEVAKGLQGSTVTMGILPKGSGNGLARHLGIPTKFASALQVLDNSRTIQMDTIRINGNLSVNVSGIGFDGHIASLFGKDGKRGLAGYTQLVLKEFLTYGEQSAKANLDGEELDVSSFIVAVANSSQFGNNARVAPLASVCDQLIDVCFIKKVPITKSIGFAARMFTGTLDRSSLVIMRKVKKARIEFQQPVAYHIDGEAHGSAREFDVEIVPADLRVLVPGSSSKL